ncbi:MAG: prepilin-type N-terminal cleavage/methylation domain-containing protein [Patescibacteria group bacterium]|jgi:prepilin-type N-terminal cleavage/methylation domain-containing protein
MCGDKTGFSLVELVTVMGMIAVLSTITLLSFRQRSPEDLVTEAANQYRSSLTLARTYARTGKTCCNNQAPQAYGVFIDSTDKAINLYAELNNAPSYQANTEDVILSTTNFDTKVEPDGIFKDIMFYLGNNSTAVTIDAKDWGTVYNSNGNVQVVFQDVATKQIKNPVTLYYPSALIE